MTSKIPKTNLYTERLTFDENKLTPTVTPFGSLPICVIGRGGSTGALCIFWYKENEGKFTLGNTISGTPANGEKFTISYPI